MSCEYLIHEINKDLENLSNILNDYYDNYDIELVENNITCIGATGSKKMYRIKVSYTEEIGSD